MKRVWLLAAFLMMGVSGSLAAHITDKLVIGLYEQQALEGDPLQLLTTGTPVEILEKQDNVLKVRLADDTKGWLDAVYVSEDKPAAMMLLEAQAELRKLKEAQNTGTEPVVENALQAELQAARERIERLEQGQADLLAARMAQSKLEALEARVQEAVDLLAVKPTREMLNEDEADWVETYLPWIAAVVALLIGFAAGAYFIDHRVRKKFGGIRI